VPAARDLEDGLEQQIISLIRVSNALGPESGFRQRETMEKVLREAERFFEEWTDVRLAYWLGITFRNYAAWHTRGDDRKSPLEKAISYLDHAVILVENDNSFPLELQSDQKHHGEVDKIQLYGTLGMMLVDQRLVRDLDKAIRLLSFVHDSSNDYEPNLCWYAQAFYMKGDYVMAAEIGLELHKRASISAQWSNHIPTVPLTIVGSSYRALGNEARKRGAIDKAVKYFQNLLDLGIATSHDRKILQILRR
jgi:tetratricopeptide (TPR) repeat protein